MVKKLQLAAFLFITIFSKVIAQNPATSIATYKNDATGAYNIIHDDFGDPAVIGINNYVDTMTYKRGLKITFGAITSACEGNPGMYTKAMEMLSHKHEIINHSHTHSCAIASSACGGTGANYAWAQTGSTRHFDIEIDQSTQSILTNTGIQPRFFIYPYDQFNSDANDYLQSKGYIGSRTGSYNAAAPNTLAPNAAGFFQAPLVVDASADANGDVVAQNLNYWVDQAITNKQWVNREMHNVGNTGWGHVTVANYRSHLDYVKQKVTAGQLWVGTISEILTYQIQKLNYTPTSVWNSTNKTITINWNTPTFNVANYLQNLQFKSPVTIKVDVSNAAHAGNYEISQNGISITDFTKVVNTLQINAYPHLGPIVIKVTNCATLCINTPPQSTTIQEGDALQLSVLATGQSGITYQWYKGSTLLSGQTSATLNIANAQLSDAGNYYVVVTNSTGTETSSQAVVTVTADPCLKLCISQQPVGTVLNSGQTLTLTVATQGVAPITYQWYKNGTIINGQTSATLTIASVASTDVGTYTVKATNSTGNITSAGALVKVQSPFSGTPINIPGTIQAENFDNGGQNISYYDNSITNDGDATTYRNNEVDIENCTDGGTGYDVGYIEAGEWLEYTVNVAAAGNYNFSFRTSSVSSGGTNGSLRTDLDGNTLFTVNSFPYTADWNTYSTTTINNIALSAGVHVLRLNILVGNFNLNYVSVASGTPIAPTLTFNNLNKTYGDAAFNVTATSNSSGAITYSLVSATPANCVSVTSAGLVTIAGVGTATIKADQVAAGSYTASSKTMTLTIDKKSLTVTADDKSMIYGAALPVLTITYSGFVGNDNASNLTNAPSISTTATSTSSVGTYPITVTGGSAANYTFAYVAGTLTVNKKSLTVTADNKTSTYGSQLPTLTVTYLGFAGTDDASSLTTLPVVTTTATSSSNAGTYPITVSGGSTSNYTLVYVAGTLTINKKSLTVTAEDKTSTYGSALPILTVTYSGFVGSDNVTSLTTAPTVSTAATASSNVGTYPITVSAGSSINYTFVYVAGTLTIGKKALTVTAEDKSMVYGSTLPLLTIKYSGFVGQDNESSLTTAPSITTAATSTSNANTYPIIVSGGSSSNYTLIYVAGTLTINKKSLTVTADDKTSIYGSPIPALTVTYSGFVGTDNTSSLTSAPSVSTSATSSSNAGTYPITVSGGSAVNYTLIYVAGTLTISKKSLTVTADDKSSIYGSALPTLTFTFTGFIGSDNPSSLTTTPIVSSTATSTSNAGIYPITVSGGNAANYTLTYVSGTLTISKKSLTVTAADKSMTYGSALPTLTLTYSGFVGTDNASNLTTTPTASTNATSSSNVGTYPITASGGSAANYTLVYVDGTLTINKKTLTVTAANKTITYGSTLPVLTFTYTGFVAPDNASNLTTIPTASTPAVQTSTAGTYPITVSGGSAVNYTFVYVAGTLTISKKSLTVTADNKVSNYGSPLPTLTMTYSGFAGSDNATSLTTAPTISTTATATSNVGAYPISVTGGNSANYTFVYVGGALTINKKSLTVTANDKSSIYGSLLPTLTLTYSGFVGNDNESSLSVTPTLTTNALPTSDAGTYAITVTGGASSNYSLNYTNGELSIGKKALTAIADDKEKSVGENNPIFTITYNGFINGEDERVLDNIPSLSSDALKTSPVGTYEITIQCSQDNNYEITCTSGTLTIRNPNGTLDQTNIDTQVYPNPVSSVLNIKTNLNISRLELINPIGETVKTSNEINTLNVSDLSDGVYYLKMFNTSGEVYINKVLIEH